MTTAIDTEQASYWWSDDREVLRVEGMLLRAGLLPHEGDREYYRGKPWKYSRERNICGRLESAFAEIGVPAHEAWEMTGAEMVQAMQQHMRARGL